MKKQKSVKKISLNKVKISKITNLKSIKGGDDDLEKTGCMFPENASKPNETTIRI
ncbi:hypothetical protein [Kaistella sp.]|uniref:hypothetical protein n=1 Tax=Kaistella sp. TaxID=2782235 RepID=UPI003C50273D